MQYNPDISIVVIYLVEGRKVRGNTFRVIEWTRVKRSLHITRFLLCGLSSENK